MRQALNELFNYGLVGRVGEDRYKLSHALVHTYARRRLAAEAETCGRAVGRILCPVGIGGERERTGRLPASGSGAAAFYALLRNCLDGEWFEAATDLVWALDDYLDYQGYWIDQDAWY